MANRNYKQGYYYERKELEHWLARGYFAWRSHASKGPYDIIAFGSDEVVVISVKSYRHRRGSYKEDTARLSRITKSPGLRRLRVEYGPLKRGVKSPRVEVEV